jgi:hypothetical protein
MSTHKVKIPATVEIRADGNRLAVWIDDDIYDGVAPPKGAKEQVLALIAEHGRGWVAAAPEEWSESE